MPEQRSVAYILHQHHFIGARHFPENAGAERDAFPKRQIRGSGFRFDLDFFARVIKHAYADVIEIEVLLDLVDDFAQHLLSVLAGDRRLRDVVEEDEIARATLLLFKEARIFDGH